MFRLKSYKFIRFPQRFIRFSGLLLVCLIVRCSFIWPYACSVVSSYFAHLSERTLAQLFHRKLYICLIAYSHVCLTVLCTFVWSYARSFVSPYFVHLLIIATYSPVASLRLFEPTFKSRPPWAPALVTTSYCTRQSGSRLGAACSCPTPPSAAPLRVSGTCTRFRCCAVAVNAVRLPSPGPSSLAVNATRRPSPDPPHPGSRPEGGSPP